VVMVPHKPSPKMYEFMRWNFFRPWYSDLSRERYIVSAVTYGPSYIGRFLMELQTVVAYLVSCHARSGTSAPAAARSCACRSSRTAAADCLASSMMGEKLDRGGRLKMKVL